VTLLDSDKTLQEKTAETLQIASKWEKNPPISQPKPAGETDLSSAVAEQPQLPLESCLPAEVILLIVRITLQALHGVWYLYCKCSKNDIYENTRVHNVDNCRVFVRHNTAKEYEVASYSNDSSQHLASLLLNLQTVDSYC